MPRLRVAGRDEAGVRGTGLGVVPEKLAHRRDHFGDEGVADTALHQHVVWAQAALASTLKTAVYNFTSGHAQVGVGGHDRGVLAADLDHAVAQVFCSRPHDDLAGDTDRFSGFASDGVGKCFVRVLNQKCLIYGEIV